MYLYKTKLDKLDLRDESTDSEVNLPSASNVLQHIGEKELYKLLKYYGQLGSWSKHIVEKILEARYMFHRFETISVSKLGTLGKVWTGFFFQVCVISKSNV